MNAFYVGYSPTAPAGIGRFIRKVVCGLALLAIVITGLLVSGQKRLVISAFEYGTVREFQGTLERSPYPTLLVARPGDVESTNAYSRYLLVAPGKHGAEPLVAGFVGRRVRIQGQLIYRGGETMLE